ESSPRSWLRSCSSSSSFFFSYYTHHPHLLLFPTRRSSDLIELEAQLLLEAGAPEAERAVAPREQILLEERLVVAERRLVPPRARSEEHTSELQSLTNLVCRLLLEKKKNNKLTASANRHPHR